MLVFDPATNEVHSLNDTAEIVFELCDGSKSKAEISVEVARRSGLPEEEVIVDYALTELCDAGLIEMQDPPPSVGRRAILRRLGLSLVAAAALPVVETIVAPAVADTSSGPSGTPTPL